MISGFDPDADSPLLIRLITPLCCFGRISEICCREHPRAQQTSPSLPQPSAGTCPSRPGPLRTIGKHQRDASATCSAPKTWGWYMYLRVHLTSESYGYRTVGIFCLCGGEITPIVFRLRGHRLLHECNRNQHGYNNIVAKILIFKVRRGGGGVK